MDVGAICYNEHHLQRTGPLEFVSDDFYPTSRVRWLHIENLPPQFMFQIKEPMQFSSPFFPLFCPFTTNEGKFPHNCLVTSL